MPSDAAALGHLAEICRHPIKSLGWEVLDRVTLAPGRTLPFDRRWALAHVAARFDDAAPGWRPKRDFVRGVAAAPLMAVQARLSEDARDVTLSHPDRPDVTVAPETQAGSDALVAWIAPLWPESRPAPARLVSAGPAQALTDQERPLVSILNRASLRAAAERLGFSPSIHRLRGNLWLEGPDPWTEFDWIGRTLAIGPARLEIVERIERCRAIDGNPESGRADAGFLDGLGAVFDHQDFGVFARVVTGGPVAAGDPVTLA